MNIARSLFGAALGARLPTHDGALSVAGVRRPVTIRRDAHGVPMVRAEDDEDLWFGLGFCHGQDRAGQLELYVRTVRGTLAAVAGAEALPIDRLARRVGFRRAAAAQVRVAEPRVRAQLRAYARGVNAGATRGAAKPSHEHELLGCWPTAWTEDDVQAVCVLLCFALAANWDMELLRLRILQSDGPEALAALDPSYPASLPVSLPPFAPAGQSLDRLAQDLEYFSTHVGLGGGSNAWALAGTRTSSGRPLVAGDPHMPPVAPSQWYLCRLETPEWKAAGATFVGVPALASGHNGHAAWAVTAGHADNTDLFLEDVGPDGKSVREGDGFVPCEVRHEVIEVKGAAPVTEEVLVTPRGPLVGPALDGAGAALSLAATWLAPRPYTGLLGMHRATSPDAMRELYRKGSTSGVSMVYADASGAIAWMLAMQLPVRRRGHGALPLAGWDPANGWEPEVVPHDALPFSVDPAIGFVATANNQPVPHGEGPFLGMDWLDGYRQRAIVQALDARRDWDLAGTRALQRDVASGPWAELRDTVLALPPLDADVALGLDLLRSWDGRVEATSVGASVYELFVAEMCRRVVRARAPNAYHWALGRGFNPLLPYNLVFTRRLSHLVRLVVERPGGFFDRPWPEELADALGAAVRSLRREHGGLRPWGEVRPLRALHPVATRAPLDRVFNHGPYPFGGDASTISQGGVDLQRPSANPIGVPTLRMVVDVGLWDESRWAILGGQSGNPLSPQYTDQVPYWLSGEGLGIAWSDEAVAAATRATLTLTPT